MRVLKYNLRHSLVVTTRGDVCTSVIHHSLLSLWTTISMAGLVPASIRRRLRHLLFPRSGSKGMGRGSLPKALASQRHSLPLTSLATFVPSSPLLPSHRFQLASLEPSFTYLKSCCCSPVLLPGSPPPNTIPAAWAQHTPTQSSWGGGDVARHAPDI